MRYLLPLSYHELSPSERRKVREQYIEEQEGLCYYCNEPLGEEPPTHITQKPINWDRFPQGFLVHPIHLQHCHNTGLTEGAVHAYCNAVLWQYENR